MIHDKEAGMKKHGSCDDVVGHFGAKSLSIPSIIMVEVQDVSDQIRFFKVHSLHMQHQTIMKQSA